MRDIRYVSQADYRVYFITIIYSKNLEKFKIQQPLSYNFKAILGFILISGLLFNIFYFASEMPKKQSTWGTWVTHTQIVIGKIEMLNGKIAEAESEQRGFLLTQDPVNMAAYKNAVLQSKKIIAEIRLMTNDNPAQQRRINELDESLKRHFVYLDHLLTRHDASATGYSKDNIYLLSTNERKNETDPLLLKMREEEDRLLTVRTNEWKDAVSNSKISVLLTVIFLHLMICVTYLLGLREIKERKRLTRLAEKVAQFEKNESSRLTGIVQIQNEISRHRMNLESAMNLIANHTRDLTSAQGSVIEQIDGDYLVYTAVSTVSDTSLTQSTIGTRIPVEGSLSGRCIKEQAVLICVDSETDERVNREMCRQLGIRSMVVVPLTHHDNPVGVIKVYSAKENAFSQTEVTTLELMATLLSSTIGDAQATRELEDANTRLSALATTDGLTGIKNHRAFKENMVSEFERSRRYKHSLCVILLDVDHFKKFNDAYGHPAGDVVLKKVAELLDSSARESDFVARYGGEEFAVMLPETTTEGALFVAERIRQSIADYKWEQREITVSVGVSLISDTTANYSELIDWADKALYASKRDGRNRVTMFTPELLSVDNK